MAEGTRRRSRRAAWRLEGGEAQPTVRLETLADGVFAIVMTLLVLVFAEVLPKTYAITRPEAAAALVAMPIRMVILVFSPIVAAVRAFTRFVLLLFGVQTDPDSHILAVREEIAGAITLGHSEGAVQKEDRDRLLGALDLGEVLVGAHGRLRAQLVRGHRRADDVEAVERGLLGDALFVAAIRERVVGDVE